MSKLRPSLCGSKNAPNPVLLEFSVQWEAADGRAVRETQRPSGPVVKITLGGRSAPIASRAAGLLNRWLESHPAPGNHATGVILHTNLPGPVERGTQQAMRSAAGTAAEYD